MFLQFGHSVERRTLLWKPPVNPVIGPRADHAWETQTTFNPAAVLFEDEVHLFYRAQGDDFVSRFGYAASRDGVHFDVRLSAPVYEAAGSVAGCEDPRATILDERLILTYVAFDADKVARIAMTSLSLEDLTKRQWRWAPARFISPPGVVDKSATLFPEKIRGRYVVLHRIYPDLLVDFVDDLNFTGGFLPGRHRIEVRPGHWDSRKIGAGPPPIKTPDGWLLLYYGVDDANPRDYRVGAMLLALDDPTRVLLRSRTPILEPSAWYECMGVRPHTVFPCGAVVLNETLFVYYGAADSFVGVAMAPLVEVLDHLKHSGSDADPADR